MEVLDEAGRYRAAGGYRGQQGDTGAEERYRRQQGGIGGSREV